MGLDITYYKGPLFKIENQTPETLGEDFYDVACDNGWLVPSNHNGFSRHAPLDIGVPYETQGAWSFRAGSYSSYNRYRERLCLLFVEVDTRVVWDNQDKYRGKPFFEQIDFGDNEDTIGPEVCAKLARDYEEHRDQAVEAWGQGDYALQTYDQFLLAFKVAGESGGAVDYH